MGSSEIRQQIEDAFRGGRALNIIGNGTKSWYGREPLGEPLSVSAHSGIISYQSTELVITARAGTKLSELADALDGHRQRLPFDPPYYGEDATIGGTVACGFSGPRRPYAGACRDFVLGCHMINGRGEEMRFGGEVMKNVAGFDVSRAMAGSLGTLGVLLDVSLKVLPHRQAEQTVMIEAGYIDAIRIMNRWAGTPLPVTAMAADGERVYFRICGTESAVRKSAALIGGEIYVDGLNLWKDIREHNLSFFDDLRPLWRLSVPSDAQHPLLAASEDTDWFIGWGGAQRWLKSDLPSEQIFAVASEAGGHATLFRGGDRTAEIFAPLSDGEMKLHRQLKAAFDPKGILNPGRMYGGI
ncbi:glycolate oxidase FAD binding subunit [Mariprofundus ferrinatatus]|uniref:Glycolate oxidase FAD binding subunit n=1 Tax=Mariprofundus ferrinatatus TaxID=1921087 RepID=A0A2K8L502_9PROT|nr:glycolate oxidase subunit GlcE [Mariprofundus ferrinatatus]ATX82192.1 glycolate oxidase FAD binding subunit [Mariprofundus ferrinatatus]